MTVPSGVILREGVGSERLRGAIGGKATFHRDIETKQQSTAGQRADAQELATTFVERTYLTHFAVNRLPGVYRLIAFVLKVV